jgi:hypothetical protein
MWRPKCFDLLRSVSFVPLTAVLIAFPKRLDSSCLSLLPASPPEGRVSYLRRIFTDEQEEGYVALSATTATWKFAH